MTSESLIDLAKINNVSDDIDEVSFGDVILIGCVNGENILSSLFIGEGNFTNILSVSVPSTCFQSLFRLTNALQYDAQKEHDRLLQKQRRHRGGRGSLEESKLKLAEKLWCDEKEKNRQKLRKLDSNEVAEPVHYGDLIQLQHVQSGKFLSSRNDLGFELLEGGSLNSIFRIESRFLFREESDYVLFSDRIMLKSHVIDGQSIAVRYEAKSEHILNHSWSSKNVQLKRAKSINNAYDDEIDAEYLDLLVDEQRAQSDGRGEIVIRERPKELTGIGEVQLQVETLSFAFKFHKYARYRFRNQGLRSTLGYLRTDQIVRFWHFEQKKTLSASIDKNLHHRGTLKDTSEGSGKLENDEARPTTMWQLQEKDGVSGALAEWKKEYYIRHTLTLKYLSMGKPMKGNLATSTSEEEFEVTLVDEPNECCSFQFFNAEAAVGNQIEVRNNEIDETYMEIEGCTFRLAVYASLSSIESTGNETKTMSEAKNGDLNELENMNAEFPERKRFWLVQSKNRSTVQELCFRERSATEDVFNLVNVDNTNVRIVEIVRAVFPIAKEYCALFYRDEDCTREDGGKKKMSTRARLLMTKESILNKVLDMIREIIRASLLPPMSKEIANDKLLDVNSAPNRDFQDRARDAKVMEAIMAMIMAPIAGKNIVFNDPRLRWLENKTYSKLVNIQKHLFKAMTMIIKDNRESELYFSDDKFACAAIESNLKGNGTEEQLSWPWKKGFATGGNSIHDGWAIPKDEVFFSSFGWCRGTRGKIVCRDKSTENEAIYDGRRVEIVNVIDIASVDVKLLPVHPDLTQDPSNEKINLKTERWRLIDDHEEGEHSRKRFMNVTGWIDCVIHFCSSITVAQDLLGTLLNNNEELLDKFVNDKTVERFVSNIRTRGPEPTTMKFFRQICSCNGKGVMSNQDLCRSRLLEQKKSRDELLLGTMTLDYKAFEWLRKEMKQMEYLEEYKEYLDHRREYEAYVEAKKDVEEAEKANSIYQTIFTERAKVDAKADMKRFESRVKVIRDNNKNADDFIRVKFRKYFDESVKEFLSELFKRLDTEENSEGKLSITELKKLLDEHEDFRDNSKYVKGLHIALNEMKFFLEKYDKDHDKHLDEAEFQEFCSRHLYVVRIPSFLF